MPSALHSTGLVFVAIVAISLLVIVHEFGHYLVARAFGMRVLTYSIGFGPVLARWRPRGSETVFQIAAIPLLAYVQVAGMNPREANDPTDRGSYQNASALARFLMVAAGPVANYLAACVALFALFVAGGETFTSPAQIGALMPDAPAAAAGLLPGDIVRQIDGRPVTAWDELLRLTRESEGRTMALRVQRAGRAIDLRVTPRMNREQHRYMIGVAMPYRPIPLGRSIESALVQPALGAVEIVRNIPLLVQHKSNVRFVSPVGIVSEGVQAARQGWRDALFWIVTISLSLAIFNLVPIPALDGGRMVVLAYEIVTGRRPNPNVEAQVTGYSLVLMLGLFLFVMSRDIFGLITSWLHART